MPLDNRQMLGTEKDGSPNEEYCMYCYQHGVFTSPAMTLDEMEAVVRREMEKRHIPEDMIRIAEGSLPHLKRWKGNADAAADLSR